MDCNIHVYKRVKKTQNTVDTLICWSETSNESDWETIILLNLTPQKRLKN